MTQVSKLWKAFCFIDQRMCVHASVCQSLKKYKAHSAKQDVFVKIK